MNVLLEPIYPAYLTNNQRVFEEKGIRKKKYKDTEVAWLKRGSMYCLCWEESKGFLIAFSAWEVVGCMEFGRLCAPVVVSQKWLGRGR